MSFISNIKLKYRIVAGPKKWVPSAWHKKVEKWLKSKDGFTAWKTYCSMHDYDVEGQADVDADDDDKTRASKIKDYFQLERDDVLERLSMAEVKGSRMKVYRCLDLKDLEEFLDTMQERGLGEYWTFDQQSVGCWGANMNTSNWWILVGWVDVKDIELVETVMKNMMPDRTHEREIKVEHNASIDLAEIYQHKKPAEKKVFKKLKLSASK
jgi:hypothetical protein